MMNTHRYNTRFQLNKVAKAESKNTVQPTVAVQPKVEVQPKKETQTKTSDEIHLSTDPTMDGVKNLLKIWNSSKGEEHLVATINLFEYAMTYQYIWFKNSFVRSLLRIEINSVLMKQPYENNYFTKTINFIPVDQKQDLEVKLKQLSRALLAVMTTTPDF